MLEKRRGRLVEEIAAKGVLDKSVLRAMRAVPRHGFVPTHLKACAYQDRPLPIGFEQTISQPQVVAHMSELLAIKVGDRVLEVGTGSGYQAAVLAELGAEVFSVEIIPRLSRSAGRRLHAMGYGRIHLRIGDGHLGWPEQAPFDGIMVTAAAPEVPKALVEQLAAEGRMVIPLEGITASWQWLWKITKDAQGKVTRERGMGVRFVPLTDRSSSPPDSLSSRS
ncbi:MAG: protein-L-isoaspartate(D-aspartate) O-methyltransferase [Candidatus Binatia bacterium]